jgi:hypothetical protein
MIKAARRGTAQTKALAVVKSRKEKMSNTELSISNKQ